VFADWTQACARQTREQTAERGAVRATRYASPSARATDLCAKMTAACIKGFSPLQAPQGTTMSSELIKHTTDATFEVDVMKSETLVLVDYWAEWCGPCKMIAPILDETAKELGSRLQITKMNVDENREIPAKFGIRGIPTLMLFKGGQLAATKVGAVSKAQLAAFIEPHL
jgi:thioredoxin 1